MAHRTAIGPVCVQVVPAVDFPSGLGQRAVRLMRPALEGQEQFASEVECWNCGGKGILARGAACLTCSGKGKLLAVPATRVFVDRGTDWGLNPEQAALAREVIRTARESGASVDITFQACEFGGGLTNTGYAHIVSGLDGEPLPSVWGSPKCGAVHAMFWPHVCYSVWYHHHRGQGDGTVELVAIDRKAPMGLGLEKILAFQFRATDGQVFEVQEMPVVQQRNLSLPSRAISAAVEKSMIYHCRRAVFAKGQYASGTSGARAGGHVFGMPKVGIGYTPRD